MNDDNESGHRAGERVLADIDEVAETMWHEVFAQTVLKLLAEGKPVTIEALRDQFETGMCDENLHRMDRAKHRGALRQLHT